MITGTRADTQQMDIFCLSWGAMFSKGPLRKTLNTLSTFVVTDGGYYPHFANEETET